MLSGRCWCSCSQSMGQALASLLSGAATPLITFLNRLTLHAVRTSNLRSTVMADPSCAGWAVLRRLPFSTVPSLLSGPPPPPPPPFVDLAPRVLPVLFLYIPAVKVLVTIDAVFRTCVLSYSHLSPMRPGFVAPSDIYYCSCCRSNRANPSFPGCGRPALLFSPPSRKPSLMLRCAVLLRGCVSHYSQLSMLSRGFFDHSCPSDGRSPRQSTDSRLTQDGNGYFSRHVICLPCSLCYLSFPFYAPFMIVCHFSLYLDRAP